MIYFSLYKTPTSFSDLRLESDGSAITALLFMGSSDSSKADREAIFNDRLAVFQELKGWLDRYFKGENPSPFSSFKMFPKTPFRKRVYDILLSIPYGETLTYGDIAKLLSKESDKKMSAQAVGGAIGSNPLCILVPCHRVIGKDGRLIGYGGGLKNKELLLKLEKKDGKEKMQVVSRP